MPRHKKNEAQLKLEGNYRKDRHGDRDEATLANIVDAPPACPDSITHLAARETWNLIVPELVYSSRVAREDVAELEIAFRALQDSYEMRDIQKGFTGFMRASEEYARIMSIITKREQRFIDIMGLYGVSSQKRLALLGAGYGAAKQKKNLANMVTGVDE